MSSNPSENLPGRYDEWHRLAHGAETGNSRYLSPWHRDAQSLAPPLADAAVLEVGCGSGDFALHLAGQARTVTAVDFSPAAIEIAQKKRTDVTANVTFQVADAQALPFPDGSFDVIFSCECLEHVPDPRRALAEMQRVLRPGGRLILTTENYSNGVLLYWLMAWLKREPFNSGNAPQPIEHFFLFWRVRRMITQAGFDVKTMIGAHHVFLALPGMHPLRFVREQFHSKIWAFLFKPLARHVSFCAMKRSGPA